MSKLRSLAEFLKFTVKMAAADWQELDHKFIRIAVSLASFMAVAFFWLYFFNSSTPFG